MTIEKPIEKPIERQRRIYVPADTHRKLKQVASHLDISMGRLLTVLANDMLPRVLQGENPLVNEDEEKQGD